MEEDYKNNIEDRMNEKTDRRNFLGKTATAIAAGSGLGLIISSCDTFGDDGKEGLKEHEEVPPDTVKVPGECPPEENEICDYFAEVPEGFSEQVGVEYVPDCSCMVAEFYDLGTGNTLLRLANDEWSDTSGAIEGHTQDLCGRIGGPGGLVMGYTLQAKLNGNIDGRDTDNVVVANMLFKGGRQSFDENYRSNFDAAEVYILGSDEFNANPEVGLRGSFMGVDYDTRNTGFARLDGPFTAPEDCVEPRPIYEDRAGMRLEATIKENCRIEGD